MVMVGTASRVTARDERMFERDRPAAASSFEEASRGSEVKWMVVGEKWQ